MKERKKRKIERKIERKKDRKKERKREGKIERRKKRKKERKASSAPFKDLFAPFSQYSTKILPVSSRSCGFLQTPSGSSGRANPVYFYVKMHPTPHLKNYVHFLVNPEQEFII